MDQFSAFGLLVTGSQRTPAQKIEVTSLRVRQGRFCHCGVCSGHGPCGGPNSSNWSGLVGFGGLSCTIGNAHMLPIMAERRMRSITKPMP